MTENLIKLSDLKPGHLFKWGELTSLFLRTDSQWCVNTSNWKSIYIDFVVGVVDMGRISIFVENGQYIVNIDGNK